MKTITARDNPLIKHVASLAHAKYRRMHQQFIGQGLRTCSTLIQTGLKPIHLFFTDDMQEAVQSLSGDAILVSDTVMEKISTTTTPAGLLGVFAIPPPAPPDALKPGIVLALLSDPGNIGTLIRTCAALGTRSVVVIQGSTDPWNPKVITACAGTIGMVDIFEWSWQELISYKKTLPLGALVVSGGREPRALHNHNLLLVIGNEAHGIPPEWLADCQLFITLPMPGGTQSFNAAVAGSIALYITVMQSY